jgi:hypothetical protein
MNLEERDALLYVSNLLQNQSSFAESPTKCVNELWQAIWALTKQLSAVTEDLARLKK